MKGNANAAVATESVDHLVNAAAVASEIEPRDRVAAVAEVDVDLDHQSTATVIETEIDRDPLEIEPLEVEPQPPLVRPLRLKLPVLSSPIDAIAALRPPRPDRRLLPLVRRALPLLHPLPIRTPIRLLDFRLFVHIHMSIYLLHWSSSRSMLSTI